MGAQSNRLKATPRSVSESGDSVKNLALQTPDWEKRRRAQECGMACEKYAKIYKVRNVLMSKKAWVGRICASFLKNTLELPPR